MITAKPALSIRPLDAPSRSQQVERALLALITRGELSAGSRLPTEQELAARFAVSRATVREAIARLRADGWVSTKPGRGALVEATSPRALRLQGLGDSGSFAHLFELRRLIEVEAAGLAATRRTAKALAAIEHAHADMTAAAHAAQHAPEADVAFHRAVASATGNPHLLSLVDFIGGHLTQLLANAWVNSARVAGGAHQALGEHDLLLAAIRGGDARAARRAATAHLDLAQRRLAQGSSDGAAPYNLTALRKRGGR